MEQSTRSLVGRYGYDECETMPRRGRQETVGTEVLILQQPEEFAMKRVYLLTIASAAGILAAAASPLAAPLFHNGVAEAAVVCTGSLYKAYIASDGSVICQGAGKGCCVQ